MTNITKRLLPLLLALAMLLSAVGCSSKPSPAPAPAPAPAVSSEQPAAAPQPEVKPEAKPDPKPAPELAADDGRIPITEADLDLTVRSAEGKNGMVSSASPIASKVGATILERGGNAVDAAVAVAYTLGLVEPNASGLGGDGYMLVYEADTGKTTFLDYKGEAPADFTLDFLNKYRYTEDYKRKGFSAVVPGMVAGMEKANEMFGTMTMAELIQPAIDYAENGVVVTPFIASVYSDYYNHILENKEASRVFLNDGFAYMPGETFTNPDYAKTLRMIVEGGKEAFYSGPVAEAIEASLAEYEGFMTTDDLARFRVAVREPVSTTYRGHKVVSGAPGSGGAAVIEALNMAEHFDVASMGHNTPEALHMWAEILKLSAVDRYHYIGDPDFSDPTGMYAITGKAFAAERVKKVDMERVLGKPTWMDYKDIESAHTTHVSIIDKWGNMVAMTNTIGDLFGNGVVVKDYGFFMNNGSFNFSTAFKANYPAPGKKVRSSIAPSLIFDPDGSPLATLGTPGGSRIPGTVTQIISNIIDFDMTMQDAIDAPRIYQNYNDGLYIEGHMAPETVYEMKLRGHNVIERGKYDYFFGGVQGVKIDNDTLNGAADPRRDGKAIGY